MKLTGHQVMVRPARKYPPTVPRLVRHMDWNTKSARFLPLSASSARFTQTDKRKCTHPDADTDDHDEISNNDDDVCWVVDDHLL